mmetsp:Transcript_31693/g.67385  ORF Transcript_31693/g.67385 Transcript_31693/m.67385 type:complete len:225 (-) Transcript_31693:2-676(-)
MIQPEVALLGARIHDLLDYNSDVGEDNQRGQTHEGVAFNKSQAPGARMRHYFFHRVPEFMQGLLDALLLFLIHTKLVLEDTLLLAPDFVDVVQASPPLLLLFLTFLESLHQSPLLQILLQGLFLIFLCVAPSAAQPRRNGRGDAGFAFAAGLRRNAMAARSPRETHELPRGHPIGPLRSCLVLHGIIQLLPYVREPGVGVSVARHGPHPREASPRAHRRGSTVA